MSTSNDATERRRVSKVTILPVSGNTDALLVRIRKMSSEVPEEEILKLTSAFKPISKDPSAQDGHSKFTMTDNQNTVSISSQTIKKDSSDSVDCKSDSIPCMKHAAQNISRKASEVPSEKVKLCNDCSKSMLSYIFLVQDFLDSLAQEISGDKTSECLQCMRQEIRNSVASIPDNKDINSIQSNPVVPIADKASKESMPQIHSDHGRSKTEDKSKDASHDRTRPRRTSRAKSHRQEVKKYEDFHKTIQSSSPSSVNQSQKVDFIYNVSSPTTGPNMENKMLSTIRSDVEVVIDQNSDSQIQKQEHVGGHQEESEIIDTLTSGDKSNPNLHSIVTSEDISNQNLHSIVTSGDISNPNLHSIVTSDSQQMPPAAATSYRNEQLQSNQELSEPVASPVFITPLERVQPDYSAPPTSQEYPEEDNIPVQHSPSAYRDGVDGIVSTLSNVEREIYDAARNRAGWESLTEPQERLGPSPSSVTTPTEAFVTSCRNNAEAIGCLVVGTSLLLCRTSKTLCVLVSDSVGTTFRGALSAVFHVVQYVRSLDSLGTTKLALLEQPELGITFDKLNIWRLTQFTKCVYLNPDTLVIHNCDELFCHEEISAVPDIGWPDCFNSGVFVFAPSMETFWKLLEFAEKQGSYDGGDQGLLNSYFSSWSSDINKKLSFIYNLMANVSYTYTPAFRQFGRNVKIVQFHGSFKPWHVKFFTNSGQVSPASPVHPTYVQFVQIWLNIFRISVLRLMSQEIQSYAASQEVICAVEILRFFPLPSESEVEFFLTPPSVRLRLAEKKLNRSTSLPISEARRRKSAEFSRYMKMEGESIPEVASSEEQEVIKETTEASKLESSAGDDEKEKDKLEDSVLESDEVFQEKDATKKEEVIDENALPGAEVGNYQGMKAWEQGRMDYQGADSSDNVIKRLQFLMAKPN